MWTLRNLSRGIGGSKYMLLVESRGPAGHCSPSGRKRANEFPALNDKPSAHQLRLRPCGGELDPHGSTPNFAEKRAQILDKELWLLEAAEVAAARHFCVLHQVEVPLEKTLGSRQR